MRVCVRVRVVVCACVCACVCHVRACVSCLRVLYACAMCHVRMCGGDEWWWWWWWWWWGRGWGLPASHPRRLPPQSRQHRWHSQPLRHRRAATSGRVDAAIERARAHATGWCSGRQTAAGPARQAAARPTWRARSVQQKPPKQPAPQRSRVQDVRACVRIGAHIGREGAAARARGFPAGGAGRRTVA